MTSAHQIEDALRQRYRQPAGVEQFGIEPVPADRRTVGWFDLFSIMFNFLINPGTLLTGGLAVNGTSGLLAMQIWAEDTNKKGGLLGRPVKLVYYDDQTNPSLVPGIYTKLLDVDKVDLVVSAYGTNVTAPALPTSGQTAP